MWNIFDVPNFSNYYTPCLLFNAEHIYTSSYRIEDTRSLSDLQLGNVETNFNFKHFLRNEVSLRKGWPVPLPFSRYWIFSKVSVKNNISPGFHLYTYQSTKVNRKTHNQKIWNFLHQWYILGEYFGIFRERKWLLCSCKRSRLSRGNEGLVSWKKFFPLVICHTHYKLWLDAL